MDDELTVTVHLTKMQRAALLQIAELEQQDIQLLTSRAIDMLIATETHSKIQASPHQTQTIQLMVCLMKLVAQTLYFASLPFTMGPPKGKLSNEGVATQWRASEKFAAELLSPPKAKVGSKKIEK